MNLAIVSLGVTLGWCSVLILPWILSNELNPLSSPAGYVLLVPLLLLVWLVGESRGGGPCPSTMHARLKWITKNTQHARLKFFVIGIFHGVLCSIVSSVLIILAMAFTSGSSPVIFLIVMAVVGLIHLITFASSYAIAIFSMELWGRRIYRSKRKALRQRRRREDHRLEHPTTPLINRNTSSED